MSLSYSSNEGYVVGRVELGDVRIDREREMLCGRTGWLGIVSRLFGRGDEGAGAAGNQREGCSGSEDIFTTVHTWCLPQDCIGLVSHHIQPVTLGTTNSHPPTMYTAQEVFIVKLLLMR